MTPDTLTPKRFPLHRGTVLRKMTPGSVEIGVVLGPAGLSSDLQERVVCVHGWIDNPPDVGDFAIPFAHIFRGIWQIASEEDAATVRALFLAHAQQWGPDSRAWVVQEPPGGWTSPPIAMRMAEP